MLCKLVLPKIYLKSLGTKLETTHSFYNPMYKNTVNCYVVVPAMGLNKCIILNEIFILPPTTHSILEPLSEHPLWSIQRNLICTQRSFSFKHKNTYLFLQILPRSLLAIWSSPLLFHSSLHHSTNATYTYNGRGIISFYKDGVLTGSRILCIWLLKFNFSYYHLLHLVTQVTFTYRVGHLAQDIGCFRKFLACCTYLWGCICGI
jgi:hypothetical protein